MSKAVQRDEGDDALDLDATTDSDDVVASIVTRGDPIRSFAALSATLVEECKLHIDAAGLHITAVDPANVAMVDVDAYAEGFNKYQLAKPDETVTLGLNVDRFRSAVSWARKRGGDGDPVRIDVLTDPSRVRVSVTRPDQQVKRTSEWFAIDPDTIRDEPDVPDLDLPMTGYPGIEPLRDGVHATDYNHIRVTNDDATLVLESEGDEDEDRVMFPNAVEGDETACSSLFSTDYLTDITTALKNSKADRLTVRWGDQFPAMFEFDHEEWGFEGRFMLAPRIQSEDN